MTDDEKNDLRPATPDEIHGVLSYGLQYEGKRRVHSAADIIAQVTVERLRETMERCGLVVMKRPDAVAPSTSGHKHPHKG